MNWNTKQEDNGTAVWLQYTGLKDKNGKELYFDDMVEVWYHRRDTFERWVIESNTDLFDLVSAKQESGAKFEIIGNIYENKELIEDGKKGMGESD